MATHADAVREAERAVVEAAVAQATCLEYHATLKCVHEKLDPAVDALLSLRAATCPTCGGSGVEVLAQYEGDCPAGCERGKRRTT